MGFFTFAEKQRRVVGGNPRCGACGLFTGCNSSKMVLAGDGDDKILVIGEAPGAEEDKRGKPFVGESGRFLQGELKKLGINMFRDCWMTNAVTCRPENNRDPTANELASCLPGLQRVIADVKPEVILMLGGFAIAQVIGQFWKSGVGTRGRWFGYQIPSVVLNAWLCPTYHPAFIARKLDDVSVESVFWRKHLAAMSGLKNRPFSNGTPNYAERIHCIYDSGEVSSAIEKLMKREVPLAFDYETDRLKPDHKDARIVSCSVSDGKTAISYPWVGVSVDATRRLLWLNTPMMAWNIKFEEKWTRRVFGKGVRNWLWDGMLATHVMDNRQGITSLKFQAFVRLGVGGYDESMSPLLKASAGNERNNICKADMGELLLYGGMDSLCTALICKQQMDEIQYG